MAEGKRPCSGYNSTKIPSKNLHRARAGLATGETAENRTLQGIY